MGGSDGDSFDDHVCRVDTSLFACRDTATAREEEESTQLQLTSSLRWMNEGMPSLHSMMRWSARRWWRVPSRPFASGLDGRMGGDQLFVVASWFGGKWVGRNDNGLGWMMVKCDDISKIRCEQIVLLVLPLLFGYKEWSWNDKNKFNISFQHPVNNVRLREARISPEPVEWVTSSSKDPL